MPVITARRSRERLASLIIKSRYIKEQRVTSMCYLSE
jgi:hypothetical protein